MPRLRIGQHPVDPVRSQAKGLTQIALLVQLPPYRLVVFQVEGEWHSLRRSPKLHLAALVARVRLATYRDRHARERLTGEAVRHRQRHRWRTCGSLDGEIANQQHHGDHKEEAVPPAHGVPPASSAVPATTRELRRRRAALSPQGPPEVRPVERESAGSDQGTPSITAAVIWGNTAGTGRGDRGARDPAGTAGIISGRIVWEAQAC